MSGSGSFNGVFRELPESRFGSIENGFTAHRIRHDHMDVSVINLSGNTLYRARVSPPDECPVAHCKHICKHDRHGAPACCLPLLHPSAIARSASRRQMRAGRG